MSLFLLSSYEHRFRVFAVDLPNPSGEMKGQRQEEKSCDTDKRKEPNRREFLRSEQLQGKVKDQFQHRAPDKAQGEDEKKSNPQRVDESQRKLKSRIKQRLPRVGFFDKSQEVFLPAKVYIEE